MMNHVAMGVGEDLELDVPRVLEVLLQIHRARSERGLALGARQREQPGQFLFVARDAHPLAAAARRRLDQHRETEASGVYQRLAHFGHALALAPGQDRHAGANHDAPRARLVTHEANMTRERADEMHTRTAAGFGEVAVFRQEAVAGMDRVGAVGQRRADDCRDVKIAVLGRSRPDTDCFVGHPHVQRVLVGRRINRQCGDIQFAAGAQDPDGDRAAIGYQ